MLKGRRDREKDYRADMSDRFEKDYDAIELHRYQSMGASWK
jgi:hypothetical protein